MYQLYLLLSWIGGVYSDISPSYDVTDVKDVKVDITTKCIFATLWGITMCTCFKCQYILHDINKKELLRKKKDKEDTNETLVMADHP